MPLYDYKCECGKVFDYIQGIHDEKLTKCPDKFECNPKHKVKRLIGSPTIISDDIGRGVKRMTDKKLYKELDID